MLQCGPHEPRRVTRIPVSLGQVVAWKVPDAAYNPVAAATISQGALHDAASTPYPSTC